METVRVSGDGHHAPVLVREILSLTPERGLYVDGTVGDGGHVAALLAARPHLRAIGLDRDPVSVSRSTARLQPSLEGRFAVRLGSYADMLDLLTAEERAAVSFVLLDLGFSSAQMDRAERGFSFQQDGPLDMRYNQDDFRLKTAAELVNRLSEPELADIIWKYGEERQSRKIARVIVAARQKSPLITTGQLADLIKGAVRQHPKEKLHPATLTFQALRIAVNGELDELQHFLTTVIPQLPAGARVAIISFHSLEDRLVKRAFRRLTKPEPDDYGVRPQPAALNLTKKPLVAQEDEIRDNPRSRSAKLRVIELGLVAAGRTE